MVESNIGLGNKKIPQDPYQLQYGVSVTDASIDWETAEKNLLDIQDKIRDILSGRLG